MLIELFSKYSLPIKKNYGDFVRNNFLDIDKRLFTLYENYTLLDNNFPRPILTFLGVHYNSNLIVNIEEFVNLKLLYISQLVRDVLAIHDDIIDEDHMKFNSETLPFSLSRLDNKSIRTMQKKGKDLALLFGDYIFPVIYKLVCELNIDCAKKIKLIEAINRIFTKTNLGQVNELLLEEKSLDKIHERDILDLYNQKAADYCYAFPFELGLIYSSASPALIKTCRDVLIQIGCCSQVVNDVEGIFSDSFNNERETLSDLLYLRRTYLLVKLRHTTNNEKIVNLLSKKTLTLRQAEYIKDYMKKERLIDKVLIDIQSICNILKKQIAELNVGDVVKEYFIDLINIRVLNNLKKVTKNS